MEAAAVVAQFHLVVFQPNSISAPEGFLRLRASTSLPTHSHPSYFFSFLRAHSFDSFLFPLKYSGPYPHSGHAHAHPQPHAVPATPTAPTSPSWRSCLGFGSSRDAVKLVPL